MFLIGLSMVKQKCRYRSSGTEGVLTHLVAYWNDLKPPGQLLKSQSYKEHSGNEAQPGEMAYYACCLVLVPSQSVEVARKSDP